MKFTALLITAISALAVRASGANVLDVYTPEILFPTEGATLQFGKSYNFTWDTSSPPSEITNVIAAGFLRQNDRNLPIVLFGNVPITQGYAVATIPWVTTGEYQWNLFGDSGNFSPKFHIDSPDPSAH